MLKESLALIYCISDHLAILQSWSNCQLLNSSQPTVVVQSLIPFLFTSILSTDLVILVYSTLHSMIVKMIICINKPRISKYSIEVLSKTMVKLIVSNYFYHWHVPPEFWISILPPSEIGEVGVFVLKLRQGSNCSHAVESSQPNTNPSPMSGTAGILLQILLFLRHQTHYQ